MERAKSFAADCGGKRACDLLAKMLEDPEASLLRNPQVGKEVKAREDRS